MTCSGVPELNRCIVRFSESLAVITIGAGYGSKEPYMTLSMNERYSRDTETMPAFHLPESARFEAMSFAAALAPLAKDASELPAIDS